VSFVKLDSKTLTSTIWRDPVAFRIFVAAMLSAEPWEFDAPVETLAVRSLEVQPEPLAPGWYGLARVSGPWLVAESGPDADAGWAALERLCSPEGESRSRDVEGRRLVRVDGGYIVVNYMKYRDFDHKAAERMRRLRARRKAESVTPVRPNGDGVPPNVTQAESREQRAEHTPLSDVRTEGPVEKLKTSTGTDTETEARSLWEAVCRKIDVPEHQKHTWLRPTQGVSLEDSTLTVMVPPGPHARWIRQNYVGKLQAALGATRLRFVTQDGWPPASDAPTPGPSPQGGILAELPGASTASTSERGR
jgi:hypothetical protein